MSRSLIRMFYREFEDLQFYKAEENWLSIYSFRTIRKWIPYIIITIQKIFLKSILIRNNFYIKTKMISSTFMHVIKVTKLRGKYQSIVCRSVFGTSSVDRLAVIKGSFWIIYCIVFDFLWGHEQILLRLQPSVFFFSLICACDSHLGDGIISRWRYLKRKETVFFNHLAIK